MIIKCDADSPLVYEGLNECAIFCYMYNCAIPPVRSMVDAGIGGGMGVFYSAPADVIDAFFIAYSPLAWQTYLEHVLSVFDMMENIIVVDDVEYRFYDSTAPWVGVLYGALVQGNVYECYPCRGTWSV